MSTQAIKQPTHSYRAPRTALLAVLALVVGGLIGAGVVAVASSGTSDSHRATAQATPVPAPGNVATCAGDGGALLATVVSMPTDVMNDVVSRLSAPTRALLTSAAEQNARNQRRCGNPVTPRRFPVCSPTSGPGRRRGDEWPLRRDPSCDLGAPPPDRRAGSHLRHRRLQRARRGRLRRARPAPRPAQSGANGGRIGMMAKRQAEVAFGVLGPAGGLDARTRARAGEPAAPIGPGRVVGRRERRRVGRPPDRGAVGRRAAAECGELGAEARVPVAFLARIRVRRRGRDARRPDTCCTSDAGELRRGAVRALLVDAQARASSRGDAAETVRLLDGALRLWRGPAFGEFAFAEFARAEAARLDELRWTAIEERVEARLTLGAHEELVGELEVFVARVSVSRALVGRADAGALSLGPSGRGIAGVRPGPDACWVRSWGSNPGATLRSLEEAMCCRSRSSTGCRLTDDRGAGSAGRRSRRPRCRHREP